MFANDDKYADETKTVTFNVEQKELTITANDQSYPFNNQMQGEDGTTYTNSADISEKITVDGLVEGDAVTVTATGSIRDVGTAANTYAIDWGETNKNNYVIAEELGTLQVTPHDEEVTFTASSAAAKSMRI